MFKITLITLAFSGATYADVYVEGYTKSDGTYVAPHYRSNPDTKVENNYSYKGNTNPYTGETGTKEEKAHNDTYNRQANNEPLSNTIDPLGGYLDKLGGKS